MVPRKITVLASMFSGAVGKGRYAAILDFPRFCNPGYNKCEICAQFKIFQTITNCKFWWQRVN